MFAAGPIPPELGKLAALKWLDLRNNALSGESLGFEVKKPSIYFQHESSVYAAFMLNVMTHRSAGYTKGRAPEVLKGSPGPMGCGLQAEVRNGNGITERDKENKPPAF